MTMFENGYKLNMVNGDPNLTDSTTALKDDKYAPVVKFMVFRIYRDDAINIIDRNGSNIIDGKSIGYIRFSELTEEKLDEAIDYILTTFGCYNGNNTVPTKFEKIQKTF